MADEDVIEETSSSPSALSNLKYKASLYSRMAQLKAEIAVLQYKTNGKKKIMGVAIFDAMQNGDHKGAEDIFMNCKQSVDDLLHNLRLKVDEYETLKEEGESENVHKPK
mmetsp:Transcript_46742/g.94283  ORF Transcript_46742/g.94283 Transcript_46742/m.94283 type:complete len:109 (-) Transcript_46742:157-483(-)